MAGMQQAAGNPGNLTPEQLKAALALRQAHAGIDNGTSGQVWYDPNLKTDDANAWMLSHDYGYDYGQGDGGSNSRNTAKDKTFIRKLRADTAGKLGDYWDTDGKYLGTYEAQDAGGRQFNTALLMAAGVSAANIAAAGGALGGGAAASGLTTAEQIAAYQAAGLSQAEIAALVPGAMAPGTMTATAATAAGGAAAGGGAAVGGGGSALAAGGGTALSVKDWVGLANAGVGLVGAALGNDAAKDATNAAKDVAQGQLDISKDALDWYKSIYAEQAPDRAAAAKRAQDVSDAQLSGMNFALEQAKELDAYNKSTFRPIEQRLAAEAQAYDTPERRAAAAASAAADVDIGVNAARAAQQRALGRSGLSAGSTKQLALAEDSAVAQGVARGAAQTGAVRNVAQQGWARMSDVANLGRGIATQQATQQQIATSTGNSSANNAGNALGATQSGNNLMQQGYGTALQGMNSAGNLFNQVARNEGDDFNNLLQGISGIGTALGRYSSDKSIKKGTGRMADAAKALDQVEATPVHEGWTYEDDPQAKPRTGPMAQDVRANMGEQVAPGGKVIDVASMNGKMLAAIKGVSQKVTKLEQRVSRMSQAAMKEAA